MTTYVEYGIGGFEGLEVILVWTMVWLVFAIWVGCRVRRGYLPSISIFYFFLKDGREAWDDDVLCLSRDLSLIPMIPYPDYFVSESRSWGCEVTSFVNRRDVQCLKEDNVMILQRLVRILN